MRPVLLELEGFASFRERTLVDFTDADLFVLSGPMGAGKSSIIDAIGFALYGSIARYQNLALVAPVISQGLQEARVRLVFKLGEQEYTAVRVVRRTRMGGGSIAEARLMRGDEFLEGDAAQVNARVMDLLGLNFEQFTKCVVLPQGDFADLLHAKPAERQELLVRLLDIGFYRRIGERAGRLRDRSKDTADALAGRLNNDLRNVTEEAYDEQARRVSGLDALYSRLEAEQEVLDQLLKSAETHKAQAGAALQTISALAAIVMPDGISSLGQRLHAAEEARDAAREEARQASATAGKLQQERGALPERAAVESLVGLHDQCAGLQLVLVADRGKLEECNRELLATEAEVEAAQAEADAAQAERDRLERAHSAYHASRGLKAGDICPVCGEKLTAPVAVAEPAGLDAANRALAAGAQRLKAAAGIQKQAQIAFSTAKAGLAKDEDRIKELEGKLFGQPAREACEALLLRIAQADQALETARKRNHAAEEANETAEATLTQVNGEAQLVWQAFRTARDTVAGLGAPSGTEGIEASWQLLVDWALTTRQEHEAARDAERSEEESARSRAQALTEKQAGACEATGIALAGRKPRDAALAAKVQAEEQLRSIDERLAERAGVEQDLEEHRQRTAISGLLATHLRSTHFERWYLQEALARLVQGASKRLYELSDEQFSIKMNDRGTDFVVIDHVNVNEERPVRTLSGGETFLASVALALALGEDIASLATRGAARLDALFLDEGFGSLDANTLETVTTAIENLGSTGRMVGIVTHVGELADRIPVKFQVSKVGKISRVERTENR